MKVLSVVLSLILLLVGCSDGKQEETERQRKDKFDERYKTPPPSDRSKDKGY